MVRFFLSVAGISSHKQEKLCDPIPQGYPIWSYPDQVVGLAFPSCISYCHRWLFLVGPLGLTGTGYSGIPAGGVVRVIPEPGSFMLVSVAATLAGIGVAWRRRRKRVTGE